MRDHAHSARTLTAVLALGLVGVLGLTACGAASQASSSSAGSGTASVDGPPAGRIAGPQADAAAPVGGPADRAAVDVPARGGVQEQADLQTAGSVIRTGSVALRSDAIGHVLVRVYGIVGGVGGDVSSEDTTTDDRGTVTQSILVLRVPVDTFDTTLDRVSQLGTLVNRIRSSRDVTTAVADVSSRVRSARQSISTLRRLFSRADRLGDIIRLESELAQREADLESLQAQQRALLDQTRMSTVTVTVERSRPVTQPLPGHHRAGGFVGGLHQGWDALTATALAVGHGLGVVLPLGTVLLLLTGLGLWCVRRFLPGSAPPTETTVEP